MMRELRYAARILIRKPAFTCLVLVTLGIGIGTSTAIFSVVNAVLLRPLPYEDPQRLVFLWNRLGDTGVEKSPVAGPDFVDYGEQTRGFEGFAGFAPGTVPLTDDQARPAPINVAWTSSNYFSLLGLELYRGVMYTPEDEGRLDVNRLQDPTLEVPPMPVVLSYELWQRRYNGELGVLGQSINVGGQSMTIIGVAPPGFRLFLPPEAGVPERIDLWTPFSIQLRAAPRTAQWVYVFARLKPGTSLRAAQEEMDRVAAWQREHFEFHRSAEMQIRVIPMHEDVTGGVRTYLVWFLLAALLVLLVTVFNATNLLLLRSWDRRREISIRAALGSVMLRLVGLVLAETTLLALLGGAVGLLLAHWGVRLLLALQPQNLPRVEGAGLDGRALAVALGVALLTALICGVVPAWQSSRIKLATALSERSATGSPTHQLLRKGLVVVEIAMSLILLIHTGLVLRSFSKLNRIDPGFRPEGVLTAELALPFFKYPEPRQRADFYAELTRRAAAIPGVESVGGSYPLPLGEGRAGWWGPWSVEGMNHDEWTQNEADFRGVLPGYFETMGIRLLRGRLLTPADNEPDARKVAVIDQIMARRAWPGEEDPVGKRLLVWEWHEVDLSMQPVWVEVVGIVRHAREDDLTRDGKGTVFCPHRHYSFAQLHLTLRSAVADPMSLVGPLRQVIAEIDPDQPLMQVRLMQDYVDDATAPTRFALTLFSVFGLLAALLAAVGLYGVISSAVQQRSREFGIRMAFGAGQRSILLGVLAQSLLLALCGLLLGLVATFFLTRGLAGLLYGVEPTDPGTFTGISLLQAVIALVASLVPAWRATRVNPVSVLNTE